MPLCSRCHGSAALEHGDLLGPQPSACRTAIARHEARFGPLRRIEREAAEVGRDPDVGPFVLVGDALRPVADRLTPEDEAIVEKFSWMRPSQADLASRFGLVPAARLAEKSRDDREPLGW